MPLGSPKAQISGGKTARLTQRVKDNTFHLGSSADKLRRLFTPRLDGRDFSKIGREFVGGERFHIHFD
jgi:hypothetical protein